MPHAGSTYSGLKDGGLVVRIAGVDRTSEVYGLEFETTNQGDGAASFWMEPTDPFDPQADWSELRVGVAVDVTHTMDSTTTCLYKGYIVSDPKVAYAGEGKRLEVECGGALDVARWRGDLAFVFTDSDTEQWVENKANPKWVTCEISDTLRLSADDGVKVMYGWDGPKAAIMGYMPYPGAEYMLNHTLLHGVKRVTGKIKWNLKEKMKARLAYRTVAQGYTKSRDLGDYTTIFTLPDDDIHGGDEVHDWVKFDTASGAFQWNSPPADGAGYLVLMLWTSNSQNQTVTHDRFVQIDDIEVYTDDNEYRVNDAMGVVADFIGLHFDEVTADVGSVLQSLLVRPMTDAVSALNTFAQQASVLVEWGWFSYYSAGSKYQWRCKPMLTNPGTIRTLNNCYSIDASEAGTQWDVSQHPEDGIMRAIRFQYGKIGRSNYPKGYPASTIAPIHPGFTAGVPYNGALCPVLAVDFSQHNYTDAHAKALAKRLARHLGLGRSSGTCTLKLQEVHRVNSPTTWRPATYIRGADWVECEQSDCGPLYVTRSHVDVDTETVTLDVGLSSDQLLEQLAAAGGVSKVPLAKRVQGRSSRHGSAAKKKKGH